VGSLSFLDFTTGSLFVYLSLPLLCSPLPHTAAAVPAMCAAPVVSALLRTSPRAPRPLPCRFPPSCWPPPALATSPAICPSCTSPPLAVAASPTPPPAFRRSTRHFSAVPPPSRPRAGLPVRPPRRRAPARAPPRLPRAPPRRQHLLAHGHIFFWTPSIFSISSSACLDSCTLLFQPFFSALIANAHRTSSATPPHRHQPPPLLPIPNPKHQQHSHDPPKLAEQANFNFHHQNRRNAAPASPLPPPPLDLPSTHGYRTSPPRSTAPSAPHHPLEVIPPLLHHPPSPALQNAGCHCHR
jgi:hypothetical protein